MSFIAPAGLSGIGKPAALRLLDGGARRLGWLLAANPSLQLDFDARRAWLNGLAYYDEASIKSLFSTFSTPSHYATGKDGLLYPIPANSIDSFYMPGGTSWGLLPEEARTNLFLQSGDLTNATAWNATNLTTITLNAGSAPDGTNSASRLQGTGTGWYFGRRQTLTAATYTNSVWVKSNTGSNQTFQLFGESTIASGNLVATTSWKLFSFTYAGTATNKVVGIGSDVTNAPVDLLVWGPQLELGAFATSYIPTAATAVTRAASSIIAADGTAVATAVQQAKAAYFRTYGVAGGQAPRLLATDGGALIYFSQSYATTIQTPSNMATAAIGGSGTYAGIVKSAFGMDAASITAKANGGMPATQATAWAGNTGNINFGNVAAGNRALNGYLSQGVFGNTFNVFAPQAVAP